MISFSSLTTVLDNNLPKLQCSFTAVALSVFNELHRDQSHPKDSELDLVTGYKLRLKFL